MAQFTPESLARLLANVERGVLVEALELADLQNFLTSDAIATLDQLQGLFNAASNIAIFGPAWLVSGQSGPLATFRSNFPATAFAIDLASTFWKDIQRLNVLAVQTTSIVKVIRAIVTAISPDEHEHPPPDIDPIDDLMRLTRLSAGSQINHVASLVSALYIRGQLVHPYIGQLDEIRTHAAGQERYASEARALLQAL